MAEALQMQELGEALPTDAVPPTSRGEDPIGFDTDEIKHCFLYAEEFYYRLPEEEEDAFFVRQRLGTAMRSLLLLVDFLVGRNRFVAQIMETASAAALETEVQFEAILIKHTAQAHKWELSATKMAAIETADASARTDAIRAELYAYGQVMRSVTSYVTAFATALHKRMEVILNSTQGAEHAAAEAYNLSMAATLDDLLQEWQPRLTFVETLPLTTRVGKAFRALREAQIKEELAAEEAGKKTA